MRVSLILLAFMAPLQAMVPFTVCSSGCAYTSVITATAAANSAAASTGLPQLVTITAGQTVTAGTFPARARNGPIVFIASTAVYLYTPGVRIAYADANVATISGDTTFGYDTTGATNSNNYTFIGIKFYQASPTDTMVQMDYVPSGGQMATPATWPDSITFDHCIFDIPFSAAIKNTINIAGDDISIVDSYLVGGHWSSESHTVIGQNVGRNFLLQNSTLYGLGTSINFMFGGSPTVEMDIHSTGARLIGNYFVKAFKGRFQEAASGPTGVCYTDYNDNLGEWYKNTTTPSWWQCQGAYPMSGTWTSVSQAAYEAADDWNVLFAPKNNVESKNTINLYMEGNVAEGGWLPGAQSQYGSSLILNRSTNDSGTGDRDFRQTTVGFVIRNNIFRHSGKGVSQASVSGSYGGYLYKFTGIMYNNLWWDISPLLLTPGNTANIGAWQLTNSIGSQTESPAHGWAALNNTYLGSRVANGRWLALDGTTAISARVNISNNAASSEGCPALDNWSGAGCLWNWARANWPNPAGASLPGAVGLSFGGNTIPQNQSPCVYGANQCVPNEILRADDSTPPGIAGKGSAPPNWAGSLTTWYGDSDVFTDATAAADVTVNAPYLGSALNGGDPGVHLAELTAATAGTQTGILSAFLRYMGDPTWTVSSGQIILKYWSVAPSQQCTVYLSTRANLASPTTQADQTGDYARANTISIAAGRYYGKVNCGGNNERWLNFGNPIVIP